MKTIPSLLSVAFGEPTNTTMTSRPVPGKGLTFNKSTLIVNLFVLIVFLQNPPWPLWGRWFPPLFLCFLISSVLLLDRVLKTKIRNKYLFYFTFLLFLFFIGFQSLGDFRTSSLVTIVIFFQLFFLSFEEKCSILNKITSVLSLIITISLPLWLINQSVFSLPFGYDMQYGDWKGDNGKTIIENYFFFVQEKDYFINRFYSIFDEPGVLGTLCAFLLFANRYNFKDKRIIMILMGGIFTYSLAFFILTFVGLLLYYIRKPGVLTVVCISGLLIGIMTMSFLKEYAASAVVLDRLLSPQSSLESRASPDLDQYFSRYISSVEFILGKGTNFLENSKLNLGGQGYKIFLIENGIIGSILVIGMYLFTYPTNRYLIFSYFLIFLLSSLQRPFLFTPYQLIVYYAGVASLSYLPKYKKRQGG